MMLKHSRGQLSNVRINGALVDVGSRDGTSDGEDDSGGELHFCD
jgi:hypothetical protein